MRGGKPPSPLKVTLPHESSLEPTSAEFHPSLHGKVNREWAIPESFQGYFALDT
jgi:hypothetical protein